MSAPGFLDGCSAYPAKRRPYASRFLSGPRPFPTPSPVPEPPPHPAEPTRHFAGSAHPGRVPWRWAYARALIRPLAVCMLPVMTGALIAVLQGLPALAFLTVGFPVAVAAASSWTLYRMQATPAEIFVRPGTAAVRSIWDCLHRRPPTWLPILELRATRTTLTLALGDAAYELDRREWPDADALLEALRTARDAGTPSPLE